MVHPDGRRQVWECFWTTLLPSGQITVEGAVLRRRPEQACDHWRHRRVCPRAGWMALSAANAKGTKYNFVFHVL
jgi:hypothetical protein